MKWMLVILLVLVIVGGIVGGVYFLNLKTNSSGGQTVSPETNSSVTKTGVLQKGAAADSDPFVLVNGSELTGVSSNSVDLNPFAGKRVEITGQFSGTTLFADQVKEIN